MPSITLSPWTVPIVYEHDSSLPWNLRLVGDRQSQGADDHGQSRYERITRLVNQVVEESVPGHMPQDCQLMVIFPSEKVNMERKGRPRYVSRCPMVGRSETHLPIASS